MSSPLDPPEELPLAPVIAVHARRRGELRAELASCGTGREAWETLAARGVIPEAWVEDPSRWFDAGCGVCRGTGFGPRDHRASAAFWCAACAGGSTFRELSSAPVNVAACAAFGAAPEQILAAEAIAREYAAALDRWRPASARRVLDRVVWRVGLFEDDATIPLSAWTPELRVVVRDTAARGLLFCRLLGSTALLIAPVGVEE